MYQALEPNVIGIPNCAVWSEGRADTQHPYAKAFMVGRKNGWFAVLTYHSIEVQVALA